MLHLFGPVELSTPSGLIDVGPAQRRAVLAALAVDAGTVLSTPTLLDRVWPDTPPAGARSALYAHLSRLRPMLAAAGAGSLERRPGGYQLIVDPDTIDLHEFVRLSEQAHEADLSDKERIACAEQALRLWRGEPLAGLDGGWADAVRQRWRLRRIATILEWARAHQRQGQAEHVLASLEELVDEDPLAEHVVAIFVEALHAAGQTARALDVYSRTRSRLAAELGLDPGEQLQHAHEVVLGSGGAAQLAGPAQLPLNTRGFVGREAELAALDELSVDDPGRGVTIAVLSGPAGVGKTALAVHWAHRRAAGFDGQLYVNLHGFDRPGARLDPVDAVRGFLDALGVPGERIPRGLDASAALLRTTLAGLRMLVVLDNARDAEQVRPLLPGAAGPMVLVTSRNRLSGLVAREGAHPVAVGLLDRPQARELLAARLGAERTRGDAAAIERIIDRCERLPLALAVVAARATGNPALSLSAVAAELEDTRQRLDVLADDGDADPRTAFSWSYRRLGADAARLFRLLPVHPGGEFDDADAAVLAGTSVGGGRRLLGELIRISMVDESSPGRYVVHDLLREYAREQSAEIDTAATLDAASARLLDHYTRVASAASQVLNPERPAMPLPVSTDGGVEVVLADHGEANAWFHAHRATLVALQARAARDGHDRHAVTLGWALTPFLDRQGHWSDLLSVQRNTVAGAQRVGDLPAEVRARRALGTALALAGETDAAHEALQAGLEAATRLDDRTELGQTCFGVGWVHTRSGEHAAAIDEYERALVHFRADESETGVARTLNAIGWSLIHTGEPRRALEVCAEALELNTRRGEVYGRCETLDSLGYAHHVLGEHEEALRCYEASLVLVREIGERYHEAETLVHIGDARRDSGQPGADEAWTEALAIFDELSEADAAAVRERLADTASLADSAPEPS